MTEPGTLRATQAFFGPRAAGWDARYPDDGPRYAAAVAELGLRTRRTALGLGDSPIRVSARDSIRRD